MYQALYRKYRPNRFEDVVGQKVIIKTLENSILNNKLSHAYLFTGPRGTGKTSTAKIFAKIINCENLNGIIPCEQCNSCLESSKNQNIDIIEIDAASNNGVDEIRDLKDKVNLVPNFGKYKVYIIDEVHMLTIAAFNALLKTLEEPPKHIIFILATTEPHKIPTTILSRCQRFDFKKISIEEIIKRLKFICKNESIKITDEAIELIANLSDGGMRDSINLLDQLTSYTLNKIEVSDVHDVFGTITNKEIYEFVSNIINNDLISAFNSISQYDSAGKNLSKIAELVISFLRNCLIYMFSSNYFEEKESKQMYEKICKEASEDNILCMIDVFLDVIKSSKNTNNTKLLLELGIIKIFDRINIFGMQKNSIKEEVVQTKVISQKNDTSIIKNIENGNKEVIQSDEKDGKTDYIKRIRINNTLCLFNRKELLSFEDDLEQIKKLIFDPDHSAKVSLIIDGKLKAKGKNYLIFVYNQDNLVEYFNSSLEDIEKIFKSVFGIDYKPIAVSDDEWEKIKKEFNDNLKKKIKKYEYIEEEQTKKTDNENTVASNKIEELFENIIEYS